MDDARIAALLEPFLDRPLPAPALEQISTYIDLLLRWNARINLTAVRHPDEIVTRHFGESFFLARHLFPASSEPQALQVLDLGSGAGFPALPLKIWSPNIRLTLVESNHKKATFLREAVRSITLTNVNVIAERAETLLRQDPPQADVVTLRAVERFDTALPLAIRFLAPAARIALLIGDSQFSTLSKLALTIGWCQPIGIPQSHSKVLAIGVRRT
jgi:16S rRNA (guanine527-N7)-methyltransferase